MASKELAFTVSENVKDTAPLLRLKSNETSMGGMESGVSPEVDIGLMMGITGFPFMSSTVAMDRARRVLSSEVARFESSFIAFRSGVESSIVTKWEWSSFITIPPVRRY